jgi:hypothetical protein
VDWNKVNYLDVLGIDEISLNNDPVRELMEKATNAMLSAGKDKAEIVLIKKKA